MPARKYFVGDVLSTNSGVEVKLIDIKTQGRVRIQWQDEHMFEDDVHIANLSTGRIQNPFERTVFGVGYLGYSRRRGTRNVEYSTWNSIFRRCYDEEYQSIKPTYVECTVDEKWHHLYDFILWSREAVGWNLADYQMDKDLLYKGNKVYGPDTCVMLPRKLNMLIVNKLGGRGELPLGVHWDTTQEVYVGQYREVSGRCKSKRFENPDDAFIYYKTNKERVVKEAAEIYKGQIDPRAYDALMSWEISIND